MGRGRADRYDLDKAHDPGQRGEPARQALAARHVATETVAVADPDPHPDRGPGQRVLARVNRRVDILEHERAHGRISNEAYLEGRIVQALFERTGLSGGSSWNMGSRVDAEVAKELAIIRRVDSARAIAAKVLELRNVLGRIDADIVRQVLGENRRYAEVRQTISVVNAAAAAGARDWTRAGKGGFVKPAPKDVKARRIAYIAQRFRDALETLAREQRRR